MASKTVSPETTQERGQSAAVVALCQIRALLPMARGIAQRCQDPDDDALMGLIGRIESLAEASLLAIDEAPEDPAAVAAAEKIVFGKVAEAT